MRDFDEGGLSWTCHVCKKRRPDAKISVCKVPFETAFCAGVQNVRYCNDRAACRRGTQDVHFFGGEAT
jgi:hypothetical protein